MVLENGEADGWWNGYVWQTWTGSYSGEDGGIRSGANGRKMDVVIGGRHIFRTLKGKGLSSCITTFYIYILETKAEKNNKRKFKFARITA